MNEMDMMSPEKVAAKYGGDKQKIGQAAQMGLLNPTVAVMAGMFIDRMRGAAMQEQAPQSTVAQDIMAPAQAAPAGLGAIAQAPMEGGLEALPTPNLDNAEYAGGGIVAFEEGGPTTPFGRFASDFGSNFRNKTAEELEILKLQDELRGKYGSASSLPGLFMSQTDEERRRAKDIMGRLTRMDVNELRQLAGSEKVSKPEKSEKQTATEGPMTGADLRKMDPAEMALRSAPGLTPAQSAANIADARKTLAVPKNESTEGVNVKAADKAMTDYAKKVKDIYKEFGVSDEPDAKTREALEKYKEKLNKDLDKAGALGLVQAGLGIAGGKSQYALQNLAGATPAIEQYSKAMSQIREGEKGILDSEAKLDQAADARARGNVKLTLELEKDARDLAIKERQVSEQAGLRREIEGGRQEQRYLNMMQNARRTAMNNIVQARKLDITAMDQNQLATLEREADALLSRDPAYQSMYKKIYGEAYAPGPMSSAAVDYGKMYGVTPKKQ
jgi:hypothetical protein